MTMNERQTPVLNRVLDNMTGKPSRPPKWPTVTTCSLDTALREINSLLACGGRSTAPDVRLTCPSHYHPTVPHAHPPHLRLAPGPAFHG